MEKRYVSINDAVKRFNKSLSTIRRLVKETPENKLKRVDLVTGHKKIYIELEYLNKHFNEKTPKKDEIVEENNTSFNDSLISQKDKIIETLEGIIKTLNNELESKNKQLAEKDKQIEGFLQLQMANNILMESLQEEKIKLDTLSNNQKKRWWKRDK